MGLNTFFINMMRMNRDVKVTDLCDGLIDYLCLRRIEAEEIYADKLLYDTVLQRLGISENYFEHYVLEEDHEMQMLRSDVVDKIYAGEDITKDLKKYKKLITFDSNLHVQFLEYTDLLKYEVGNFDIKTLLENYEKVISLTVPSFVQKDFTQLLLGDVEVYLITKYAMCYLEYDLVEGLDFANEFLKYFKNYRFLSTEKVRCYSTFVLKLSTYYMKIYDYNTVINLVDDCIEFLRKSENYTNLLSLINLKIQILSKVEDAGEELKKLRSWAEVLGELYKEYNVNPDDDANFTIKNFAWTNYHVISDVIKKRRLMYGFSQEKLAEGICDVKTISRIENKHTRIHPKNASKILEKLGLSGELYSHSIVTRDAETYTLCVETTKLLEKNEYAQVIENLKIIEKKLDLSNKINLQYFGHKESVLKLRSNRITEEQFIEEAKRLLSITFPIKCLDKKINIHFTKKEIILICILIENLQKVEQHNEMYKYIAKIESYFVEPSDKKNHYQACSFFYRCKENIMGNMGDFENSNNIIYNSIILNFKNTYFRDIVSLCFDVCWNNKEQAIAQSKRKKLYVKDKKIYMKSLKTPYILAEIFNYDFMIKFIDDEKKLYP